MIFGKVLLDLTKFSEYYKEIYKDFVDEETTSSELFANYSLGILMIASFVLSSAANPFIFWFKWQEKKNWTLSKSLFMMLAISDFLTNLFKPIRVAKNLLGTEILPIIRNGTQYEAGESVFFHIASITSVILTMSIAICRFISVKSPFKRLSAKLFLAVLVPIEIMMLALYIELTFGWSDEKRIEKGKMIWFLHCQSIMSKEDAGYGTFLFYFKTFAHSIPTFLGVLFSGGTVSLLIKKRDIDNKESFKKRIKSAYAVVAMNFATFIGAIVYILYQVYQQKRPVINFLGACGMNIILSAFNPVIRIYFSTEMKTKLWYSMTKIKS